MCVCKWENDSRLCAEADTLTERKDLRIGDRGKPQAWTEHWTSEGRGGLQLKMWVTLGDKCVNCQGTFDVPFESCLIEFKFIAIILLL